MFNGSKATEAAPFHLRKVLYPQHLFSSLHCAPAHDKHCVRMNYMVNHVIFIGSTAHFCMKRLPTYLVDHMLLWLTFSCGPSGDAMQGIPKQALEDWQGRENGAFRLRKQNRGWSLFPEVSVDVIKPEKNTLTFYSSCMGASNKSLFLANFRMNCITVKMHQQSWNFLFFFFSMSGNQPTNK